MSNIDDLIKFLNAQNAPSENDATEDFSNRREVENMLHGLSGFGLGHGAPLIFVPSIGTNIFAGANVNLDDMQEDNNHGFINKSQPKIVEIDDNDELISEDSYSYKMEPKTQEHVNCEHKCKCYNEIIERLEYIENLLQNTLEKFTDAHNN
jgi:hypothetical protein